MNLDASVRTRGLAGPSVVVRAATGFGFSNPPQAARVNLAGLCLPWDACSSQDRVNYVVDEYKKMYGVVPSQAIIQAAGNSETVYKDTLYKKFVVNMPPPTAGASTPPVEAAQSGSTGPLDNRSTVLTPNAYPNGGTPANTPVTPGDVQMRGASAASPPAGATLRPDGTAIDASGRIFKYDTTQRAWVEEKGPLGLPATIGGYPTTTVLGVGVAVLVAVAVALAYSGKRRR